MGDMQINKLEGDCALALYKGQTPHWRPSSPMDHGTPNQKMANHGLLLRLDPHNPANIKLVADALATQKKQGHQVLGANELLTDSHAPIWYLHMSLLLDTVRRWVPSLVPAVMEWFSIERYLCDIIRVPAGPLAGSSIGVCSRFGIGHSTTRDVCQQLWRGDHLSVGEKFFTNAVGFQDTFAAIITRDLVRAGVRITPTASSNVVVGANYQVTYYASGHLTKVDAPIEAGDPTACWVIYQTGIVGDDRKTPIPDLGEQLSKSPVRLSAASAA